MALLQILKNFQVQPTYINDNIHASSTCFEFFDIDTNRNEDGFAYGQGDFDLIKINSIIILK